jgi:hypothetical protein
MIAHSIGKNVLTDLIYSNKQKGRAVSATAEVPSSLKQA